MGKTCILVCCRTSCASLFVSVFHGSIYSSHCCDDITDLDGVYSFVKDDMFGNLTSLVLQEVKSIDHVCCCLSSVNTYTHQAKHCSLHGVKENEWGSKTLRDVKLYVLESAHMEERLVIDCGKTWVMKHIAVQKASRLDVRFHLECIRGFLCLLQCTLIHTRFEVSWSCLRRWLLSNLHYFDLVFSFFLVEFAVHQCVKVHTGRTKVS